MATLTQWNRGLNVMLWVIGAVVLTVGVLVVATPNHDRTSHAPRSLVPTARSTRG